MGSGYCVRIHPRRFSLNDDGVVELRTEDPPKSVSEGPVVVGNDELAAVREAVKACPSGAITVTQEGAP